MYKPKKVAPGVYAVDRDGIQVALLTSWNGAQRRAGRLRRAAAARDLRVARAVGA